MWKPLEPIKQWIRFWKLLTTWVYKLFKEWNSFRWKDECICDCWNITYVIRRYLYNWKIKSCWCLKKEKIKEWLNLKHWDCYTRFYWIWDWMLNRCLNEKNASYDKYWWRWINVCDEWKDYVVFKNDMFESYTCFVKEHWEKNTTLDRIDNNKWYFKENCRRATSKQQSNNTRRNFSIEYKWKKYKSLSMLCNSLWIDESWYKYIWRLIKEWTIIEDAVFRLFDKNGNRNKS